MCQSVAAAIRWPDQARQPRSPTYRELRKYLKVVTSIKSFSSPPPLFNHFRKKPTEFQCALLRGLITEDYPIATGRILILIRILIRIRIQGPSAMSPSAGDNELFWPAERAVGFLSLRPVRPLPHPHPHPHPHLHTEPPQPQLAYCPCHCQLENGIRAGAVWRTGWPLDVSGWPLASQNPQGARQGVKPAEPGAPSIESLPLSGLSPLHSPQASGLSPASFSGQTGRVLIKRDALM